MALCEAVPAAHSEDQINDMTAVAMSPHAQRTGAVQFLRRRSLHTRETQGRSTWSPKTTVSRFAITSVSIASAACEGMA